jgi:hypothetical protein
MNDLLEPFEFPVKDQRIQRQVTASTELVDTPHNVGETLDSDILGSGAGVESNSKPEVDGIGPGPKHSRDTAFVASGSKYFGKLVHPLSLRLAYLTGSCPKPHTSAVTITVMRSSTNA